MNRNSTGKAAGLTAFLLLLLAVVMARPTYGGDCLFEGPVGDDYLKIECFPDGNLPEIQDSDRRSFDGSVELALRAGGDCKSVFWHLLRCSGHPDRARLYVETNDRCCYHIFTDKQPLSKEVVAKVAETLGLEFVQARQTMSAYVMRANGEPADGLQRNEGKFKWPSPGKPESRLKVGEHVSREIEKFPGGGVLFCRCKYHNDDSIPEDDNHYFDGVTFDELAQRFERLEGRPFVNRVDSQGLYSFSLPHEYDTWKTFSVNKPLVLPGLGITVTYEELEIDAFVLRDKKEQLPLGEPPAGNRIAGRVGE